MVLRFTDDAEFNRFLKNRANGTEAKTAEPEPVKARGGLKPRKMNKTEQAYAAHLDYEKSTRQIVWYEFEALTLRIGDDCRFTPDFLVMLPDGQLEFRDTKGRDHRVKEGSKAYATEDAVVKMRACSERYPFRFFTVYRLPEKEGGGWVKKEY